MCRIAYVPDPRLLEYEDFADLFSYLESGMGGDGNGLAFAMNGAIRVIKGVSLDTDLLARIASDITTPVLFHTRRATSGGVCNALCQPFVDNGMALAHNGMWTTWASTGMELLTQGFLDGNGPINDSLTAAALVGNYGRYALEAISSGVFVVMTLGGTAWLHLRRGTFKWCPDMGIYASGFPTGWPAVKSFGDGAIVHLGRVSPTFECGDWWTAKQTVFYHPGSLQRQMEAAAAAL